MLAARGAGARRACCVGGARRAQHRRPRCRAVNEPAAVDGGAAQDVADDAAEAGLADELEVPERAPAPAGGAPAVDLAVQVGSRRTFAIISHPDAGKTTLTEKLLLYGGAINEAGSVKARRDSRSATSDWMEMEQQRGISITSTALTFGYGGYTLNLLDTPGHADFSEDTYRTLSAADNALMLVDAAKGLEPQTRKLFEVCRINGLPVFTFCNKLDRPALEPLELLDQIEKEFDLPTYPVNWPIGSGDRFRGVYHRTRKEVHLFTRGERGKEAKVDIYQLDDPALELIEPDLYELMMEEIELIDELGTELDLQAVWDGQLTPVFFGSAMNNFGVELFLDAFLSYAQTPRPKTTIEGDEIAPTDEEFTGFVFKLQANMDPKHRDKVAFVRVVSGEFQRGMKVKLARTGKQLALTRPQKLFSQDRDVLDVGYAGDIIGLNNPGQFAIGDTIYAGNKKRTMPPIPSFSPEIFAYLRNADTTKYKAYQKGVAELLAEGAAQVLYSMDSIRQDPIMAAVGQLQYEVVQHRLESEYGVRTVLEPLPFTVARWVVGGWEAVESAGDMYSAAVVKDQWDRPVLLFRNQWNVDQLLADNPDIGELSPYAIPPSDADAKA